MVCTSLRYKLVSFKIAWTPIYLPSPGRFLPPKHLGTPWALCGPLYLGQAGTLTETSCLWGPVPPLALIPRKVSLTKWRRAVTKSLACSYGTCALRQFKTLSLNGIWAEFWKCFGDQKKEKRIVASGAKPCALSQPGKLHFHLIKWVCALKTK